MRRDLTALAAGTFDVLVIGGGMYGACTAWDAARRGLSVALIERRDFGSGTSAHSFKMVHGGIRYLQHADIPRIRESVRERRALLRIAPHLVRPLPILMPTYGHGASGKAVLAAGMAAYDVISFDRNKGVDDPARQIPRCRLVSRAECLSMFAGLEADGLTGGGMFSDAQMFSASRLVLAFVMSAAGAGARVANYVSALKLTGSRDRITGVQARDEQTGEEFDVRARIVLNCAGPWAESLLSRSADLRPEAREAYTIDSYYLLDQPWDGPALAVRGADHDRDALISRKARHLFVAPWRGRTLVGVWHKPYDDDPDEFRLTEQDVAQYIVEANKAYPPLAIERSSIAAIHAGLVLSARRSGAPGELRFGKRSRIIDHAAVQRIDGLITVIGVRATTARGVAESAVNLAFRKLDYAPPVCDTATAPVHGGNLDFHEVRSMALKKTGTGLSPDTLGLLVDNHGGAYGRVLQPIAEDPDLALSVGASSVSRAEALYAVREEMATTLDDLVTRRTDLGIDGNPGHETLAAAARLMAEEIGWSADRTQIEVDQVARVFADRGVA